ncbi:MAG: SLC13 family permease [Bacillaceae bacterium]|nr:SLC13 family permease [Bacillaceae bacterium]
MTIPLITVTILMLLMFYSLIKEWFSPELTVFTTFALLVVVGILPIDIAFNGFSNPAVHTIALLMVIAYAVQKCSIIPILISRILRGNKRISTVLVKIMVPVSFLSAFMNNTPIVAMLTPIVHKWGIQHKISPSKLLIPLSYAAIIGGTITLIGTSTNLLVHGLLQQHNHSGFSMFQFSLIGIPLFFICLVYMILFGHKRLPDTEGMMETYQSTRKKFTIELKVTRHSSWVGQTVKAVNLRALHDIFLVQIIRNHHSITPVSNYEVIQEDDTLIFSGNIESIVKLKKIEGLKLTTSNEGLEDVYERFNSNLVEVVISHSSPLLNKKVKQTNFRARYNAAIVAIRRNNQQITTGIGNMVIKTGDTMLLLTGKDFIKTWSDSRDFYVVSDLQADEPISNHKTKIIITTLIGVITLASFQIIPILQSALLGCIVLIITKCITTSEIKKAIDWGILVLIASAIGIANAVEIVGLPSVLTNFLSFSPSINLIVVCFMVYLSTVILTEIISNIAAAALMFPIGLSIASQLGIGPELFSIIIAIASSCSFITPIGYQTNLLVYGPGGYKFIDFVKVGFPLSILCMVVTVLLSVFIWG